MAAYANGGIDERYITGNTDWREKFIKYAAALELRCGESALPLVAYGIVNVFRH